MACGSRSVSASPPIAKVPCSRSCAIRYTVRLDPAFSERERKLVWTGLTTWSRASRGAVCYEPQQADPRAGYNLIVVRGETADSIRPFHDNYERIAAIYHDSLILIAVKQTKGDLDAIAAHEAGHALGLDHNDDPTSIMHPVAGGLISGELPLRDQRTFWSLRCK